MAVVYQSRNLFTAADGTALTSYTPDQGPSWSAGIGTFKTLSNQLVPNSNANGDIAFLDASVADHTIWADVTPSHSGSDSNVSAPGLLVRYSDTTHHWLVHLTSAGTALFENAGGGYTFKAQNLVSYTSGTAYRLQVTTFAANILVYVNGVLVITYTSATSNQTATKVGLRLTLAGSPPGTASWNNLTVPYYTSAWDTLGTGKKYSILRPMGLADGTAAACVVYHHGVGEDEKSVFADTLKSDVIAALCGAGYRVISSEAHDDNWGDQNALDDYEGLLAAFTTAGVNTSATFFLSQSMGGCSGLLGLADGRWSPLPAKWYGIYPVCSLANMFGSNAGTYAASIRAAYGIASDGSDYSSKTSGYDPLLLAASSFDGIATRFVSSYGDTVVDRAANSDAMASHVTGHATEHTVVTATGNHGDPSAFMPQDVLDFFAGLTGGIAFDAAGNSAYQSAAGSYSGSASWSGSNRMLSIDVQLLSVTDTVTAMTYGGAACTFIGAQNVAGGTGRVECWRILQGDPGAPGTGANTLSVTLSGSLAFAVTWVSRTGVNQSLPTEGFNSASGINVGAANASVTITPVADSTVVHAACATNDAAASANQTGRNDVTGTAGSGIDEDSGAAVISPAAAQTMTVACAALKMWTIAGYAVRPIAAYPVLPIGKQEQ